MVAIQQQAYTLRPMERSMDGRLASRVIAVAAIGVIATTSGVPEAVARIAASAPDATAQTGGTRVGDYEGGRVYAVAPAKGTTYLGGAFTTMRPKGVSFGGRGTVTRNHLAAIDATGALTSWNPNANREVRAVAVGPDGTIYVGGAFTAIGGVDRKHLAAIDPITGAVTKWNPGADGEVHSLLVAKDRLYVGGSFATVGGRSRTRLAAFSLPSLRLNAAWRPAADDRVLALARAPDGSILVGGYFGSVSGRTAQDFLADVDPKTGAVRPMASHPSFQVEGIAASSSRIVTGEGGPGGKVQGFAWPGMSLRWTAQFDGDVQAVAIRDTVVYAGGHYVNYCRGRTGSGAPFQCDVPIARGKLAALAATNGALFRWNPRANGPLGAFALRKSAKSLLVGGEFTTIHGIHQQGFARFTF
jgi:hypothetical protein